MSSSLKLLVPLPELNPHTVSGPLMAAAIECHLPNQAEHDWWGARSALPPHHSLTFLRWTGKCPHRKWSHFLPGNDVTWHELHGSSSSIIILFLLISFAVGL